MYGSPSPALAALHRLNLERLPPDRVVAVLTRTTRLQQLSVRWNDDVQLPSSLLHARIVRVADAGPLLKTLGQCSQLQTLVLWLRDNAEFFCDSSPTPWPNLTKITLMSSDDYVLQALLKNAPNLQELKLDAGWADFRDCDIPASLTRLTIWNGVSTHGLSSLRVHELITHDCCSKPSELPTSLVRLHYDLQSAVGAARSEAELPKFLFDHFMALRFLRVEVSDGIHDLLNACEGARLPALERLEVDVKYYAEFESGNDALDIFPLLTNFLTEDQYRNTVPKLSSLQVLILHEKYTTGHRDRSPRVVKQGWKDACDKLAAAMELAFASTGLPLVSFSLRALDMKHTDIDNNHNPRHEEQIFEFFP